MTCHVIYTTKNGYTKVLSFKDIVSAEDWIENRESNEDYTSMQIVVDYAMVDFYKEKFDELYKEILKKSGLMNTSEPKTGGSI